MTAAMGEKQRENAEKRKEQSGAELDFTKRAFPTEPLVTRAAQCPLIHNQYAVPNQISKLLIIPWFLWKKATS